MRQVSRVLLFHSNVFLNYTKMIKRGLTGVDKWLAALFFAFIVCILSIIVIIVIKGTIITINPLIAVLVFVIVFLVFRLIFSAL
jgi:ABC-type transport system involved in Fe-S cluster assembly fused permease/ATPase subunit